METERLEMRQVVEGDWELFRALHADPAVMRWVSDPLGGEEIRRRFEVRLPPWDPEKAEWLCMAIRERATGAAVGVTGVRAEWAPFRQAEVGFLLLPAFQGRGYAGESLAGLVRFGFGECGFHKLKAVVTRGNDPSCRVLERAGFRREGLLRHNFMLGGQWMDDILYGLLEADLP